MTKATDLLRADCLQLLPLQVVVHSWPDLYDQDIQYLAGRKCNLNHIARLTRYGAPINGVIIMLASSAILVLDFAHRRFAGSHRKLTSSSFEKPSKGCSNRCKPLFSACTVTTRGFAHLPFLWCLPGRESGWNAHEGQCVCCTCACAEAVFMFVRRLMLDQLRLATAGTITLYPV